MYGQSLRTYAAARPPPTLRINPSSSIDFRTISTIAVLISGHLIRISFLVTLPSVEFTTDRMRSDLLIRAVTRPSTRDSSSRYAFKIIPNVYSIYA